VLKYGVKSEKQSNKHHRKPRNECIDVFVWRSSLHKQYGRSKHVPLQIEAAHYNSRLPNANRGSPLQLAAITTHYKSRLQARPIENHDCPLQPFVIRSAQLTWVGMLRRKRSYVKNTCPCQASMWTGYLYHLRNVRCFFVTQNQKQTEQKQNKQQTTNFKLGTHVRAKLSFQLSPWAIHVISDVSL
jgi:hypothetical protein